PSLEVEVAAALFLLHERPAAALGEIGRFRDSRAVAVSALAAPMAPHLRAALAEIVARSSGGAELLERQLESAVARGEAEAATRLAEALAVAAPALAAQEASALGRLAGGEGGLVETFRLDALSGAPGHEAELAESAAAAPSAER